MYMYFITYPNANHINHHYLELVINSFYPLNPFLVLTTDNFLSIFPPTLPLLPSSCFFPGGSYSKLLFCSIFTVCSYTFILFWLSKAKTFAKRYQLSYHVLFYFICTFYPITYSSSFFFFVRDSPFYSYFYFTNDIQL